MVIFKGQKLEEERDRQLKQLEEARFKISQMKELEVEEPPKRRLSSLR